MFLFFISDQCHKGPFFLSFLQNRFSQMKEMSFGLIQIKMRSRWSRTILALSKLVLDKSSLIYMSSKLFHTILVWPKWFFLISNWNSLRTQHEEHNSLSIYQAFSANCPLSFAKKPEFVWKTYPHTFQARLFVRSLV